MITWNDLKVLIAIAGAVGTLFAVIAYYLSKIFQNPQLEAFSKKEVVEILISTILPFVLLPSLSAISNTIVNEIDPIGYEIACREDSLTKINIPLPNIYEELFEQSSKDVCFLKVPYYFMHELFYEAKYLLGEVMALSIVVELLSSVAWEQSILGQMGMVVTMHPFSPLVAATQILMKKMLNYIISITTNIIYVLAFLEISPSLAVFFIAIGAVLRMFFFSRKLGGLLMAIGLALLFVFPITITLGSAVFHSISESEVKSIAGNTFYVRLAKISVSFLGYKTQSNFDLKEFSEEYDRIMFSKTLTAYDVGKRLDALAKEVEESRETAKEEVSNIFQTYKNSIIEIAKGINNYLKEGLGLDAGKIFKFIGSLTYLGFAGMMTALKILVEIGGKDYTFIDALIDIFAAFYFFLLIPILLAAIGAIATVKSLSPLLGGDTEIAGLTHFI